MQLRQLSSIMFFSVLFAIMFLPQLNAQNKKQIKFYNRIYGEDDNDFEVLTADGKWPEASAIILCDKTHFSLTKSLVGIEINGIIRRRVLIQDKVNLEDFATYYFQDGETVGLKVVKPNGSEIEIDLKDAIEVVREVPSFYKRKYLKSSYFKIAIANLEVGDILEYYNVFKYSDSFSAYYEDLFAEEYPVLKKEITFDLSMVDRAYFNTYNTDTKFEVIKGGGKNRKGKDKKSVNRLRIVEHDIEPRPEDQFLNEYLVMPHFRLSVFTFMRKFPSLKKGDQLQDRYDISDNVILQQFQEIDKKQSKDFRKTIFDKMGVQERKYFPEAFFYACRYFWNSGFTPNYFLYLVGDRKMDVESVFGQSVGDLNSTYFISYFSDFLGKNDFEHDILVVVPNSVGDENTVVTPGNAYYGIYVNEVDQIFWSTNNHRHDREVPFGLVGGATGYRFNVFGKDGKKIKKIKDPIAKKFVLPPLKSSETAEVTYINMTIDENMKDLSVSDSTVVKGPYKNYYYFLLPKYMEFIFNDHLDMYENEDVKETKKRSFIYFNTGKTDYQKIDRELKNKSIEYQEEAFENNIKATYSIDEVELLDYNLLETGRTFHSRDMVFKTKYNLKDYIKKAGPNYILNAGGLIGGQKKLTDDEMKARSEDADMGFAKQFENHIEIKIPEGYTVKGIENLNVNIDNENMKFESVVTFENQVLNIYTLKEYKKEMVAKESWDKLVEVLETAYDFSQKKLILSKQ